MSSYLIWKLNNGERGREETRICLKIHDLWGRCKVRDLLIVANNFFCFHSWLRRKSTRTREAKNFMQKSRDLWGWFESFVMLWGVQETAKRSRHQEWLSWLCYKIQVFCQVSTFKPSTQPSTSFTSLPHLSPSPVSLFALYLKLKIPAILFISAFLHFSPLLVVVRFSSPSVLIF